MSIRSILLALAPEDLPSHLPVPPSPPSWPQDLFNDFGMNVNVHHLVCSEELDAHVDRYAEAGGFVSKVIGCAQHKYYSG